MKKLFLLFLIGGQILCGFAQNGNVGIGTTTPGFPLNFATTTGDKISLYGNTGNHYGFGIQSGLLQIHSDAAAANIAFGFGSSGAFTERAKIINGGTDGMILNGRLHIKNGSLPVDVNQTPGVWLYRADNANLLGFMGTQNNQNIGFYGGPANGGWGFTYDAVNSRVGIGTSTPTSSLNVNGQITVDQKNFGGYGGLLLKGNVPGSNYPNIAFTIKNNAATPTDVVAAMVQGDLVNNAAGAETIDLTFLTSNTGLGGLSERLRIKNNGAIGIGGSTGVAGQVLTSNGSGSSASWASATSKLFNNMYQFGLPTTVNLPGSNTPYQFEGLNQNITISQTSRVLVSMHISGRSENVVGNSIADFQLYINNSSTMFVGESADIPPGRGFSEDTGFRMITLAPGVHNFKMQVRTNTIGSVTYYNGDFAYGIRMTIIVIPE